MAKWTDTTAYANLAAPDDADLLPIADMSLADGSRQKTTTIANLKALITAGLTTIRTAAGATSLTSADNRAHVRITAAGAVTIPTGLALGANGVIENATVSDVVTLTHPGVTLVSAGVSIAPGKWVAWQVVGTNVVAAAGAFVDDPALPATTLAALTDVDLTGLADGDVLVYDSGTSEWLPEAPSGGGGTFTALTDTPANYTGHALKVARVNAGETALEFAASGGSGLETGTTTLSAAANDSDRTQQYNITKSQTALSNTNEVVEPVRIVLTKDGNATANVFSALTVKARTGTTPGTGNLHAINAILDVFSQSTPDEATPLFVLLQGSGTGRLWGTDQNIRGPSAAQANALIGASINLMNQHSGAVANKAVGLNVTAVKENEAQANARTYPGDFGVLVNGRTGDAGNTTAAFTVGLGIGQAGGGWLGATAGKITTGIEVTNVDTLGLSFISTVAASVGLRLKGHASQSGDLVQVRSSADANLFSILSTGEVRLTQAARSTISFNHSGSASTFGRIQASTNASSLYILENASFNGASWNRDDTGGAAFASVFNAAAGFEVRAAAAAANPITWTIPFKVTPGKNVVVGDAALATSATDGFLYIPTTAGNPTGAPTAYTGTAAMVLDSTNNRLYVRNGATWRYATLT